MSSLTEPDVKFPLAQLFRRTPPIICQICYESGFVVIIFPSFLARIRVWKMCHDPNGSSASPFPPQVLPRFRGNAKRSRWQTRMRGRWTALGVIRAAVEVGKEIAVISCETRPLNQGSRLTVGELMQDKIPVTLIPDYAAGLMVRAGNIDEAIVGADRITGDAVF